MTIYYSSNTNGFYSDEVLVKDNIPDDAIEIDEAQHKEMLYQLNMKNKDIVILNGNTISYVDRKIIQTWDTIRIKRNSLLKDSDHKVMPDYPSDKEAWGRYRQALRDITKTFTNPNEVIWPTEPK